MVASVQCCLECGSEYSNKANLKKHVLKHHPLSSQLKDIARKANLKRHVLKHHPLPSQLKDIAPIHQDASVQCCLECGREYANKANLKRHVLKHHPLSLQLKDVAPIHQDASVQCCLECGRGYANKGNLKRHVLKHHPLSSQLKDIEPAIHQNAKNPIKCPKCLTVAFNMKGLLQHVSQAHDVIMDTYQMTFSCASGK